jgi:hypothetical protein
VILLGFSAPYIGFVSMPLEVAHAVGLPRHDRNLWIGEYESVLLAPSVAAPVAVPVPIARRRGTGYPVSTGTAREMRLVANAHVVGQAEQCEGRPTPTSAITSTYPIRASPDRFPSGAQGALHSGAFDSGRRKRLGEDHMAEFIPECDALLPFVHLAARGKLCRWQRSYYVKRYSLETRTGGANLSLGWMGTNATTVRQSFGTSRWQGERLPRATGGKET